MVQEGRREVEDLQRWIRSHPAILGEDLALIGEQIPTKTGLVDFLAIDRAGNLVVVELKRDRLPREVLAQALDYASDIAGWDADKVSEVCVKYAGQTVQDLLNESFGDIDLGDLIINKVQRILLVGFSIEEPLQRMIEWLSSTYGVSVNAVILNYIKTKSGDELIARTMIIPEEIDRERVGRRQIQISMSDEPGNYEPDELEMLLRSYLTENRVTPRRIREIVLPLCLKHEVVTRDMIKDELIRRGEATDEGKAGIILTTISREIGIKQRDYLRQVIAYDRPNPWEKDNYRLVEEYRSLVSQVLSTLGTE
ncbi:MAG TPA: DUF91 domain-containing protein [Chloroflexi bacterium]|nr:DUF91 domain-containing protein [Chloroflexota bacterium]